MAGSRRSVPRDLLRLIGVTAMAGLLVAGMLFPLVGRLGELSSQAMGSTASATLVREHGTRVARAPAAGLSG